MTRTPLPIQAHDQLRLALLTAKETLYQLGTHQSTGEIGGQEVIVFSRRFTIGGESVYLTTTDDMSGEFAVERPATRLQRGKIVMRCVDHLTDHECWQLLRQLGEARLVPWL